MHLSEFLFSDDVQPGNSLRCASFLSSSSSCALCVCVCVCCVCVCVCVCVWVCVCVILPVLCGVFVLYIFLFPSFRPPPPPPPSSRHFVSESVNMCILAYGRALERARLSVFSSLFFICTEFWRDTSKQAISRRVKTTSHNKQRHTNKHKCRYERRKTSGASASVASGMLMERGGGGWGGGGGGGGRGGGGVKGR